MGNGLGALNSVAPKIPLKQLQQLNGRGEADDQPRLSQTL